MESRTEGPRDLSPEQCAGRGAVGHAGDQAGESRNSRRTAAGFHLRPGPAHHAGSDTEARARLVALAGPPQTAERQRGLGLASGEASARHLRDLRFAHHQRPQPSVRGLGERRGAAARTRRAGEIAVDGHAHAGSGVGAHEARDADEDRRRRRVRHADAARRRNEAHAQPGFRVRAPAEIPHRSNWARWKPARTRPRR